MIASFRPFPDTRHAFIHFSALSRSLTALPQSQLPGRVSKNVPIGKVGETKQIKSDFDKSNGMVF